MQYRRNSSRSMFKVTAFLALVLTMMATPLGVMADNHTDATPEAGDMGDCVMALGIGEAGNSCINVVHASPDAPAVDVYLNGDIALEGLEFANVSGWVAVPAGDHQVQVTATGEDIETAVIDAEVTTEEGAAYHIAATGLLEEIAPAIFQVDLSMPEDDTTARIRVLHTAPDAPAVDVAVTGGDVLVENVEFPNASDFLEVPADSYDLEVRPTGTEDVVLELPGVELEAGLVYDVFAIGLVEDETLNVLVVPSTTTAPEATPEA